MDARDAIARRYSEILTDWRTSPPRTREDLAVKLSDYRIHFAYNSGRIENPSITYHDTREVFENGKAVAFTGFVHTLFEIQNQRECGELLLDAFAARRAIDEALVLEVHRSLTQGTYDEHRWTRGERPGAYKVNDYVMGVNQVGSPSCMVAADILELLDELDVAKPSNALRVAAYFHLAFELIRPFAHGNGQVGRALMNHLLVMNEHPPIIIYNDDRLAYYGAIQVWNDEGDLTPMLNFLRAETVKTWSRTTGT